MDGAYQGDNSNCQNFPCFIPPETNVCCVNSGCIETTELDCVSIDGLWLLKTENCNNCPEQEMKNPCCVVSGCVNTIESECTELGGVWLDSENTCDSCTSQCESDLNGDGVIDIEDLLVLIAAWGACP